MIARLLISPSINKLREQIACNLEGCPTNHPDVLYFKQDEKLGIAQARKIKEHFSLKPYSAKGRTVILEDASSLTVEAQNALLKTLEELPKEAVFILGANSEANLLPTVLSRCQIIRLQTTDYRLQKENYTEEIEKLLEATIEQRFEYIEKLKEREEFLYSLTSFFHKKLPANADFVKKLLQAEEWTKQNVQRRAILEYLMLVMPRRK